MHIRQSLALDLGRKQLAFACARAAAAQGPAAALGRTAACSLLLCTTQAHLGPAAPPVIPCVWQPHQHGKARLPRRHPPAPMPLTTLCSQCQRPVQPWQPTSMQAAAACWLRLRTMGKRMDRFDVTMPWLERLASAFCSLGCEQIAPLVKLPPFPHHT